MAIEHDRKDAATETVACWLCVIAANGTDTLPAKDAYHEDEFERFQEDFAKTIEEAEAKLGHLVAADMRDTARDMVEFIVAVMEGEMDEEMPGEDDELA